MKNTKKILALLLVYLTSCTIVGVIKPGPFSDLDPANHLVDPAFRDIVERFDREIGTNHRVIENGIHFDDELADEWRMENRNPNKDIRTVGACMKDRWGSPQLVSIDRNFWDRSNALAREQVLYHELGHCLLNRGHSEEKAKSKYIPWFKCPRTIMKSSTFTTRELLFCYKAERERYINELKLR